MARRPYMHRAKREAYKPLTPRQLDALQGWWIGESTEETAARMEVQINTVRYYRDQARLRLNHAPNLPTAIRRAIVHGYMKADLHKGTAQ